MITNDNIHQQIQAPFPNRIKPRPARDFAELFKTRKTIKNTKFAFIGAGKMGETLLKGLLDSQTLTKKQVIATARHTNRLKSECQKSCFEGGFREKM